jgi:excisionase family DNA binding protein
MFSGVWALYRVGQNISKRRTDFTGLSFGILPLPGPRWGEGLVVGGKTHFETLRHRRNWPIRSTSTPDPNQLQTTEKNYIDTSDITVYKVNQHYRRTTGETTMEDKSEFITVEELAERLKVNPRTIQRIIQRKELPAIRVGRQWRFRREWVSEWLNTKTVNKEVRSA